MLQLAGKERSLALALPCCSERSCRVVTMGDRALLRFLSQVVSINTKHINARFFLQSSFLPSHLPARKYLAFATSCNIYEHSQAYTYLPRRDLVPPSLPSHPTWTSCFEEATLWTCTSPSILHHFASSKAISSPPLRYRPCIFTRHSSFRFVRLPVSSTPRTNRLFFSSFTHYDFLQPCRILLPWL
jgi:hypothetical protein